MADDPREPVVVDVSPDIGLNADARAQLIATLKTLAGTGYGYILLNVQRVTYIDSVLLGAIIQAYVGVIRSGGALKLLNAPEKSRRLLVITNLDRLIRPADLDTPDR